MERLKKLFGGINLTWPKLIIFAIIAGIYTAVMAIVPIFEYTSFNTIAVTMEVWILFGILIIMNSKSNLDSALKCFVFFLISQPLVYLIQVPFSWQGWGLFQYYKYWFIWTILCLPMGYIGYYMKKDKWWGYLILFPMIVIVGYSYFSYLSYFQFNYPYYILIVLFCIVTMILYPIVIFNDKKIRTIGVTISCVIIIALTVISLLNPPVYSTNILASNEKHSFDDSYTVRLEDEKYGDVSIVLEHYSDGDYYYVHGELKHAGHTTLYLASPDGEETEYDLTIERDTYKITKKHTAEDPGIEGCEIQHELEFGGVYIKVGIDDFNKLGFEYGDSVNVAFSNGYTLEDIPYYNGYYVDAGDPLLIAYPGYDYIKAAINYGQDLWEEGNLYAAQDTATSVQENGLFLQAGLDEHCTASVYLNERGKYLDIQEARDIHYYDERERYPSDAVFANFRNVTVGKIPENILYRSASPCDNQHNRAPYVDALISEAQVQCILNLSDNDVKIEKYIASSDFNSPYFLELYERGSVIPLAMSMNFTSDDFTDKVVQGFSALAEQEGPYLVHCTEGKDRTGFVCMLLESLAGASYQEIVDDYMITYDNYYKITQESDPAKYDVILDKNLVAMIRVIVGDDSVDITTADLSVYARKYLVDIGMSENKINLLRARLTGKEIEVNEETEKMSKEDEEMTTDAVSPVPTLVIEANGKTFYAEPEDNTSADGLIEKLSNEPLELELHDYGSFEKVGPLPWSLPRNDTTITTVPGDVILYQGNQITIYYDQNTWDFTLLARIEDVTKDELLQVFGDGNVTVKLSVEWSE